MVDTPFSNYKSMQHRLLRASVMWNSTQSSEASEDTHTGSKHHMFHHSLHLGKKEMESN